jgi:hypothetical protein
MALRLKSALLTSSLLIALSFTFERQAHAYVDPGSSLLLFQSLSAVVSGALFYFRRRIKSLFSRSAITPSKPAASISAATNSPVGSPVNASVHGRR